MDTTKPEALGKTKMDKNYDHNKYEKEIYKMWEDSGYFSPSKKGEPYTILMPPPNANASLHAGHAMYTVDDILIRYKRMQGFASQWIPGMDHAGFETQFVFEKHLKKDGKSRMDYDRNTLYKMIFDFVEQNSGLIYEQFKRLGFSADWERSVFTLDENVINTVYETFSKMVSEDLVYRDNYIVNYCVHCGTSLAELEVKHIERYDNLYYVRYPLVNRKQDEPEYVVVATTRPEPIFIDTHLAVNPNDKKQKWLVGRKVLNPLTKVEMEIINDDFVDPDFGTGVVKLTPAHDPNDFEVAKKNNLPIVSAFDLNGHLVKQAGEFSGLFVKKARSAIVAELQAEGLMEKIDNNYLHSVSTCYKCGNDLEPMIVPNWFINVSDLKKPVIKAVTEEKVKFYPKKFKKQMLNWLESMHDWPISRQIVWGIRIPAWYDVISQKDIQLTFVREGKVITGLSEELLDKFSIKEIETGLQNLVAPTNSKFKVSAVSPGDNYLQETDTFDTWFSSGQWPLVTLSDNENDLRFPTNMIGTLSDILKFWISRMIMFSLYLKQDIPFKDVYLWSMVADSKGIKMSKSKGNVIDPIDLVDKYGADALRFSLIFGGSSGSKVILSEDKVRGMRNFGNKIWNMARFMNMMFDEYAKEIPMYSEELKLKLTSDDKEILDGLKVTIEKVNKSLNKYRFADAADAIYHYMWDELADKYIEIVKNREDKDVALSVLRHAYIISIKLLHPFMPFVTEAVWESIPGVFEKPLMTAIWPISDYKSPKSPS